ncbi:MAG: YfbR-like 5'-deoxynucleotidase, partial [Bacillota bacterium]
MNPFFAYLNRLKLIRRWGLMRNAIPENDMEHSMQCSLIAHALAVLAKERYGKAVDPQTAATLALYHDAGEVLTGDLPTP